MPNPSHPACKPGEKYGNRALTAREHQVIDRVAAGLTNADVGRQIGTTEHMIKNYLRVIYDKLGFSNRVELALWWEAHYGPCRQRVTGAAPARNAKAGRSAVPCHIVPTATGGGKGSGRGAA